MKFIMNILLVLLFGSFTGIQAMFVKIQWPGSGDECIQIPHDHALFSGTISNMLQMFGADLPLPLCHGSKETLEAIAQCLEYIYNKNFDALEHYIEEFDYENLFMLIIMANYLEIQILFFACTYLWGKLNVAENVLNAYKYDSYHKIRELNSKLPKDISIVCANQPPLRRLVLNSINIPHATLEGHEDWVIGATWSPDGTKIASYSADTTVKIWDVYTRACLHTLAGHNHSVNATEWNPDSTKIASCSNVPTVKIWDIDHGICLHTLIGHADNVNRAEWSPDGTRLVTCADDAHIKIWDVDSGDCLHTFEGHVDWINAIQWNHSGTRIASCSDDNTIKIWDVNTGTCLHTLINHTDWIDSILWNHDDTKLVSCAKDQTVRIWDAINGTCLHTLTGHSGYAKTVQWSPDYTKIASSSTDGIIKIWDAHKGTCLHTIHGHNWMINSAPWSPDGTKIASCSKDNTIKIWNAHTGKRLRTINGHTALISSTQWSSDGTKIISTSWDTTIKIWDLKDLLAIEKILTSITIENLHLLKIFIEPIKNNQSQIVIKTNTISPQTQNEFKKLRYHNLLKTIPIRCLT